MKPAELAAHAAHEVLAMELYRAWAIGTAAPWADLHRVIRNEWREKAARLLRERQEESAS